MQCIEFQFLMHVHCFITFIPYKSNIILYAGIISGMNGMFLLYIYIEYGGAGMFSKYICIVSTTNIRHVLLHCWLVVTYSLLVIWLPTLGNSLMSLFLDVLNYPGFPKRIKFKIRIRITFVSSIAPYIKKLKTLVCPSPADILLLFW